MQQGRQFNQHPALAALPPAPGTAPLPDGHRRMYHQTSLSNVDSIRRRGLLWDKGRGLEGPKGVWLSDKPFYGEGNPSSATVEVALGPEHGNQPILATGDIHPSKILAIHEPWHDHVRSLVQDPDMLKRISSGEFDGRTGDNDHERQVLKAVSHIRKNS